MRVLFLSDLETLGGAGLSASRLASGLVDRGVEVVRLFNNPDKAPHAERVNWESHYVGPARPAQIAIHGAQRVVPALAKRAARAISGKLLRDRIASTSFELIHVHSIQNSDWSHEVLATLDPELKTVWTFHDCWSFSAESQRYQNLDGKEVRLKPDGVDRPASIALRKRYFSSRRALRLIANSEFTAQQARATLELPVEVILPGVPLDRFRPADRGAARKSLHLGDDRFVLAFIADNRGDPLKGFELLCRALAGLDHELDVLVIGDGPKLPQNMGRARMHVFGRVLAPELLSILYSAADLLVVPSLAEALGMVSMESIACGTPVLGSRVGGIPEVVRPGETGFLFESGNVEALRAALEARLRDRESLLGLAARCRSFAEQSFSIEDHVNRHLEVYRASIGR